MPEIQVRPALSTDLPFLVQITSHYQTSYVWQMNRVFDEGQVTVNFREVKLPRLSKVEYPRSTDKLLAEIPLTAYLLASEMQGVPIGYIRFQEDLSPNTLWVTDIVVKEEVRRQGIASAMLTAVRDWAEKRRLRRLVVEMQSKNSPAIRMVTKLGYEFCGYQDQYYPNRDIALFFERLLR